MQVEIVDGIKQFLVADMAAAFPNLSIVYDNDPFDWNNLPADFLIVDVEMLDGKQVGMAVAPKTRVHGCVFAVAYARLGTGTRRALVALDWMGGKLAYAYAAPCHLQEPQPQGSGDMKGYYTRSLKVPFYSDPS